MKPEALTAPLPEATPGLRHRIELAFATIGVAAAIAGSNPAEADASPTPAPAPVTNAAELPSFVYFNAGSSRASVSDVSSGRVKVLQNISATGTPKHLVRKAEANGDCFNVGKGTEHPTFWNQGYDVSSGRRVEDSKVFGLDNRKSRVCEIGGKLIRIACNNEVKFRKPIAAVEVPVVFIQSAAKSKLRVTANAYSSIYCEVNGAKASATGSASSSASMYLRNIVKTSTKGNVKTATSMYNGANLSAYAKVTTQVACDSAEVIIVTQPPTPPAEHQPTKPAIKDCDQNIDVCS